MSKPLFTIGLMTYNNAAYIEKAITSVLNQTFADWEMIISDDNSKDNTSDIISPYLSDPRITYVKHIPNLGQAMNWSYLIKNATGKYFATLHADDYWDNGYLTKAANAIQEHAPELIQFNWIFIDENDKGSNVGPVRESRVLKGKEIFYDQLRQFSTLPSATVFNLKFAQSVSSPNPDYRYAVDFDFFIRLAVNAKTSCQINSNMVYYRVLGTSITSNHGRGENWKKERSLLRKNLIEYFNTCHLEQKAYTLFELKIAKWALISASQYAKEGKSAAAIKDMLEAIKASPSSLKKPLDFIRILAHAAKGMF